MSLVVQGRGSDSTSKSDRIRSVFGAIIFTSDRIRLEKYFRNRIGSDFHYQGCCEN